MYFLTFSLNINNILILADYIKPCSKSDPKLNECAKNSAIAAIPTILKGNFKLLNLFDNQLSNKIL